MNKITAYAIKSLDEKDKYFSLDRNTMPFVSIYGATLFSTKEMAYSWANDSEECSGHNVKVVVIELSITDAEQE